MTTHRPTALIAEDEPLLALALQKSLQVAWPDLAVLECVGDGLSAVRQALALQPDVLFFDIQMPGQSGLEAAAQLQTQWGEHSAKPFPALVFVTAFDAYAIDAFEAQAQDYLLKPLQMPRLQKTVAKLQETLASRAAAAPKSVADMDTALNQLRTLLGAGQADWLDVLQVSVGGAIHMVPVADVVVLEAADKYVRVLTAGHEYLVRTPLKELLPRLNPRQFWQIHRGTVVQASHIERVLRSESGKLQLSLRSRPEKLPVSRLYAHLFRAL